MQEQSINSSLPLSTTNQELLLLTLTLTSELNKMREDISTLQVESIKNKSIIQRSRSDLLSLSTEIEELSTLQSESNILSSYSNPYDGTKFLSWMHKTEGILSLLGWSEGIKKIIGLSHRTSTLNLHSDDPLEGCNEEEITHINNNKNGWLAKRETSKKAFSFILNCLSGEYAERVNRIPNDNAYGAIQALKLMHNFDPLELDDHLALYHSIQQGQGEEAGDYIERTLNQVAILSSLGRSIPLVEQKSKIVQGMNKGYREVIDRINVSRDSIPFIQEKLREHEQSLKQEARREKGNNQLSKKSTSPSNSTRTRRERRTTLNNILLSSIIFYLDSGATSHNTTDPSLLSFTSTRNNVTVVTADNSSREPITVLTGCFGLLTQNNKNLRIENVISTPLVGYNILSASALEDQFNVSYQFGRGTVKIIKDGEVILEGIREGKLYKIEVKNTRVRSAPAIKQDRTITMLMIQSQGRQRVAKRPTKGDDEEEEKKTPANKKAKTTTTKKKETKKKKTSARSKSAPATSRQAASSSSQDNDNDNDEKGNKGKPKIRTSKYQSTTTTTKPKKPSLAHLVLPPLKGFLRWTAREDATHYQELMKAADKELGLQFVSHKNEIVEGIWPEGYRYPVADDPYCQSGSIAPFEAFNKVNWKELIETEVKRLKREALAVHKLHVEGKEEYDKKKSEISASPSSSQEKELDELHHKNTALKNKLEELLEIVKKPSDVQVPVNCKDVDFQRFMSIVGARFNGDWRDHRHRVDTDQPCSASMDAHIITPVGTLNTHIMSSGDANKYHRCTAWKYPRHYRVDGKLVPTMNYQCENECASGQGEFCEHHNKTILQISLVRTTGGEYALRAEVDFLSPSERKQEIQAERDLTRRQATQGTALLRKTAVLKYRYDEAKTDDERKAIDKEYQALTLPRGTKDERDDRDALEKHNDLVFDRDPASGQTIVLSITGSIFAVCQAREATRLDVTQGNAKKVKDTLENGWNDIGHTGDDLRSPSRYIHEVQSVVLKMTENLITTSEKYSVFINASRNDSSIGRHITHSDNPNCDILYILTPNEEPMIHIVTARHIKKGETLTANLSMKYRESIVDHKYLNPTKKDQEEASQYQRTTVERMIPSWKGYPKCYTEEVKFTKEDLAEVDRIKDPETRTALLTSAKIRTLKAILTRLTHNLSIYMKREPEGSKEADDAQGEIDKFTDQLKIELGDEEAVEQDRPESQYRAEHGRQRSTAKTAKYNDGSTLNVNYPTEDLGYTPVKIESLVKQLKKLYAPQSETGTDESSSDDDAELVSSANDRKANKKEDKGTLAHQNEIREIDCSQIIHNPSDKSPKCSAIKSDLNSIEKRISNAEEGKEEEEPNQGDASDDDEDMGDTTNEKFKPAKFDYDRTESTIFDDDSDPDYSERIQEASEGLKEAIKSRASPHERKMWTKRVSEYTLLKQKTTSKNRTKQRAAPFTQSILTRKNSTTLQRQREEEAAEEEEEANDNAEEEDEEEDKEEKEADEDYELTGNEANALGLDDFGRINWEWTSHDDKTDPDGSKRYLEALKQQKASLTTSKAGEWKVITEIARQYKRIATKLNEAGGLPLNKTTVPGLLSRATVRMVGKQLTVLIPRLVVHIDNPSKARVDSIRDASRKIFAR